MKPRLLDLFCCAGGAAKGYADAGFEVVGVDIDPQPNYPYRFFQLDWADFIRLYGLDTFDAIHASPPCQFYSNAQRIMDNEHPDLIGPVREALKASGLPYIIENVAGAPLINPIELCGSMFGLGTYRHRLFETSFPIVAPPHPTHTAKTTKMGRAVKDGEMMHVVGHFSGVAKAREAMDIPWMKRDELREAIPPAYTEYIGNQILTALEKVA